MCPVPQSTVPGFEGVEKRLELWLTRSADNERGALRPPVQGLGRCRFGWSHARLGRRAAVF